MSDAAKYLPLSHRDREDESTVTNDWSGHFSSSLDALAAILDSLPADGFEYATAREQYRGADVVAQLVWRLQTPRLVRFRQLVSVALRSRSNAAGARLEHSRALAAGYSSPAEAAAQLRALAARARSAGHRHTIAELSAVVVDGYDVAQSTSKGFTVDPVASGAVALARSLSAPVPIRAVLRDCTLHATDDGWSVGHGPARGAGANQIVLFLWGRAGIPAAS